MPARHRTKILNFGSLNLDLVYRVPRIVRPGETLASLSCQTYAGGKGANQSAALARAGAAVWHAGNVGRDGAWLTEKLRRLGVNTDHIRVTSVPTGQAIIQVDILILNETEGAELVEAGSPSTMLSALARRWPGCEIVLTLGARGVLARGPNVRGALRAPAIKTEAVDTTAAGDTFIGYCLAARSRNESMEASLKHACSAAALCVARPGAMDSIPSAAQVARACRRVG